MEKQSSQPQWAQKLVQDLKRDPRKAIILGVLTIVGVWVGAKAIFKGGNPESANAAVASAVNTSREIARTDSTPIADASQDARRDQYLRQLNRKVDRDLFALKTELFPLAEPVSVTPTIVATAPTTTQASQPDVADIERKAIVAQSELLRLQSVISGPSPTAIINDHVLRVGEWTNDFQVVAIADNSCVVQKKDVRVTLELKKEK